MTPVSASTATSIHSWANLPSGPLNKHYTYIEQLTGENARIEAEKYIENLPDFPENAFDGRGIVICGGGVKYFTCAWVNVNMLRRLGCTLPIQLWYLGEQEMSEKMKALMAPLGVECVDALEVREKHPVRILNGWELKPYAIIYSRFREVLFLDADNVPVVNPEYLFSTEPYQQTGVIFWPDYWRLKKDHSIWELCGISYRDEPEFESGQIVVDKARCWCALCLTLWYNEYSDFFYRHIHGDKETFHLAFRKLNQPYAMPEKGVQTLDDVVMCQHDFTGKRIFQHRNLDKWDVAYENRNIANFSHEKECFAYLNILRASWDEWKNNLSSAVQKQKKRPKYFQEVPGNSHYDARFFKVKLCIDDCHASVLRLLKAFTEICAERCVRPILMHGGLIGWNINKKMLPWDDDIDVCLSLLDLQLLDACRPAYDEEKFLFDFNPFYRDRTTLNKDFHDTREPNKIDARFIDKATGCFIDITALDDEGETVATKCPHRYRKEMIFPLQQAEFHGIKLFVPADVPAILIQEYGSAVLNPCDGNRCGYTFDTASNEYQKIP